MFHARFRCTLLSLAAGAAQLLAQPTQFRGDAAHTGVYDAPGVPAFGGLQWRVATGGAVRGSPTISRTTLYSGSSDGNVYAIDLATGNIKWKHDIASPVMSTPAVANGTLFITGYDGTLRALGATDGHVIWTFRSGVPAKLQWGFESGETYIASPTVFGTSILLGARDGNVYAVDAATGHQKWHYATGARVYSTPAVSSGTVFVGSQDGVVHAIDLASGTPKWRFATQGTKLHSADFGFDRTTIQSSPAVQGSTVFIGARDGWLYAIDAATGKERWNFDHKVSWVNTSPAVSDGVVYAASSDGHFIQGVDMTTGAERWRTPSEGVVWSSPALDHERVYDGDGTGVLYALDRKTGKEAWRYRVGGRIFSSPVVHNDRVYFGSDDGGIYAVNAAPSLPMKRAVFWDTAYAAVPFSVNHVTLRNYLRARGYEALDTASLATFMAERVRDRAPSVVVFTEDFVPPSVARTASDTTLFRRYLDAGGTIVWLGIPPMMAPLTAKTLKDLDRDAPQRLIGVRFDRATFDPFTVSTITPDGRRLGLAGWWLNTWAANAEDVTTVFAFDEQGQAAAWRKTYGGPPGSGFVRLFSGEGSAGQPRMMEIIQTIAELRPR